jgi:hypothetical protein
LARSPTVNLPPEFVIEQVGGGCIATGPTSTGIVLCPKKASINNRFTA